MAAVGWKGPSASIARKYASVSFPCTSCRRRWTGHSAPMLHSSGFGQEGRQHGPWARTLPWIGSLGPGAGQGEQGAVWHYLPAPCPKVHLFRHAKQPAVPGFGVLTGEVAWHELRGAGSLCLGLAHHCIVTMRARVERMKPFVDQGKGMCTN